MKVEKTYECLDKLIEMAEDELKLEKKLTKFLIPELFEFGWSMYSHLIYTLFGETILDYVEWYLFEIFGNDNTEYLTIKSDKINYHIKTKEDLINYFKDFNYLGDI